MNFDSGELVCKAVKALNDKDAGLRVTPLQYTVQRGEQMDQVTDEALTVMTLAVHPG